MRRGRLPADPRRLLRSGSCRHRSETRLRAHLLRRRPTPPIPQLWRRVSRPCRPRARAMLDRAGVAGRAPTLRALGRCALRAPVLRAVRCRAGRPPSTRPPSTAIADAFHDRHRQTYGHDNRSEPVQIVNLRVAAIGTIPPLTHPPGAGRRRRRHREGAAARSGSARPAQSKPESSTARACQPGSAVAGPCRHREPRIDHSRAARLDRAHGRRRLRDARRDS